ncbi:SET domain-containing protein 9 [Trichoplax sp. H2]|nr:SET domain-containing protein 9 [Trichoplax sp. H2]|eukprot:RDD41470.1 SET domain-containing protein 9 [Trichoplax sp. H2]
MQKVLKWWQNYKYRFVPYLIWKLKDRTIKYIPKENSSTEGLQVKENEICNTLKELFYRLDTAVKKIDIRKYRRNYDSESLAMDSQAASMIMMNVCGFTIARKETKDKGIGVYVSDGYIPPGKVVALYPGTIYQSHDSMLFQSIRNSFMFRCVDGTIIDGKDHGISKAVYMSCTKRDILGHHILNDITWLTSNPVNPMAIGQYINNQSKNSPANVIYHEINFPEDLPLTLYRFIPNVYFRNLTYEEEMGTRKIRMVILISTHPIMKGEELRSSYFTVIT